MNLSGTILQQVYEESTAVDESSDSGHVDSSLSATITPIKADSIIAVQFHVPRIDVGLISGSHSERTASVRVWNETDGVAVGDTTIVGRVLKGTTSAACTSTGSAFGFHLFQLPCGMARTFRLQFAPGIPEKTQARLRGDRSAFKMWLQEIEALP